jgi:hypothetical protein
MLSAFAFSSAQRTLPCKVCLPRMASTWMVVPLTPSVVKRASLGFVVIQTSGVAARAGAANATRPQRAHCTLSHMFRS